MDKIKKLIKTSLGYVEFANKPTSKELNDYYREKYYQNNTGLYKNDYTDDELKYIGFKIKQQKYVVEKIIGKQNGKLMDVGCGEGHTMRHYHQQGWEVKGIDFSLEGIEKINPGMMPFTKIGNMYELINKEIQADNFYDAINLTNVLEHVIDPLSLMQELKKIIKKSGCLVVTVPNDFSDLQKFLYENNYVEKKYWVAYPDHLSYFNYSSLINLVQNTGWHYHEITADLPIDWNLLNPNSNYLLNKEKGKSAHYARIQLEQIIAKKNMNDIINFYSSLAKIGQGRNLTIFLSLKS